MKVLVQWSAEGPRDWIEVDSSDWQRIPARPIPQGDEVIGNQPGWVHALNVQGLVFTGADHYAVEDLPDGCRVYAWQDDPEDAGLQDRVSCVATILHCAPDPLLGGAVNTRQQFDVYLGSNVRAQWPTERQHTTYHRIEDFPVPPPQLHRHGVWTSDELHDDHAAKRAIRGWREWTDGVPLELTRGGRIAVQRALGRYARARGTRTYYASNTGLSIAALACNNEEEAITATGSAASLTDTINKAKEEDTCCFTTPANEPNSAAWPAGIYRYQLDVTTADATYLTYGCLTLGTANGGFRRLDSSAASVLEGPKAQAESAFSGTGLKLATTGSVSWTSGSASDRFNVSVAAANSHTKNNYDFVLQVNEADDFIDGPWPAALTPGEIVAAVSGMLASAQPTQLVSVVGSSAPKGRKQS